MTDCRFWAKEAAWYMWEAKGNGSIRLSLLLAASDQLQTLHEAYRTIPTP